MDTKCGIIWLLSGYSTSSEKHAILQITVQVKHKMFAAKRWCGGAGFAGMEVDVKTSFRQLQRGGSKCKYVWSESEDYNVRSWRTADCDMDN